jgi:hypothetical protein
MDNHQGAVDIEILLEIRLGRGIRSFMGRWGGCKGYSRRIYQKRDRNTFRAGRGWEAEACIVKPLIRHPSRLDEFSNLCLSK